MELWGPRASLYKKRGCVSRFPCTARVTPICLFSSRVVENDTREKVFDSDDGGGSGGDDVDEDGGGGDDVMYDKFGNVIDKAAAERAALQELRDTARAARAAKVNAHERAEVETETERQREQQR